MAQIAMGMLGALSPGLTDLIHPPMKSVGLQTGELRAYRGWKIDTRTKQLFSFAADTVWEPGQPMTGDISYQRFSIPLGVYAWKTDNDAGAYNRFTLGWGSMMPIIGGSVDLWGDIAIHQYGYRASFAAIASLDYVLWHGPERDYYTSDEYLSTIRQRYLE